MQVNEEAKLERTLGPLMLWGLGVGYVISGMYFGWNLGLPQGGTLGLAISTLFITVMYVLFTFSYCELACAIPKAGGAFDYANRALGPNLGFVAGLTQLIEFVFAPPAIAFAIGAYFHEFLPHVPVITIAIIAFFLFTCLNIWGVKAAASFELVITIFAVVELLIFAGVSFPAFKWDNMAINAFPNGVKGIFASVPFAIWFFLAIEGIANVAEETINPQVNVIKGFGSAMLTLVILCFLTFFSSIGVAGWEAIVYPVAGELTTSDSPLPLALSHLVGKDSLLYHMLLTIGLFGLVASFHGIILAAGRVTFEFGRVGYFPRLLGKTHAKFKTPMWALLGNMLVGILALVTGKTGEIITIACFGALGLYSISLISFFKLRQNEPNMHRPFKAQWYPYAQIVALVIAIVAMISMILFNFLLAGIYFGLIFIGYIWYMLFVTENDRNKAVHVQE
jgi:ethanolamine permease